MKNLFLSILMVLCSCDIDDAVENEWKSFSILAGGEEEYITISEEEIPEVDLTKVKNDRINFEQIFNFDLDSAIEAVGNAWSATLFVAIYLSKIDFTVFPVEYILDHHFTLKKMLENANQGVVGLFDPLTSSLMIATLLIDNGYPPILLIIYSENEEEKEDLFGFKSYVISFAFIYKVSNKYGFISESEVEENYCDYIPHVKWTECFVPLIYSEPIYDNLVDLVKKIETEAVGYEIIEIPANFPSFINGEEVDTPQDATYDYKL